jgi:hypothetical protein
MKLEQIIGISLPIPEDLTTRFSVRSLKLAEYNCK